MNTIFNIAAILICCAVALSYLNEKYLHGPPTPTLMFCGLAISSGLLLAQHFGFYQLTQPISNLVMRADLQHLLLNGLLSFLLFAGALHIDLKHIKGYIKGIAWLAGPGTLINTALITLALHQLSLWWHHPLPWLSCALFGALISPTDPVAVLKTFEHVKAPPDITLTLSGESLFNDGVGIVIFLSLLAIAQHPAQVNSAFVLRLFIQEAIGGLLLGAVLGRCCELLIRGLNDDRLPVLVTIAIVTGGYALAQYWHVSGPLAMVVAGLFVQYDIQSGPEKRAIRQRLSYFWRIVDELCNAILFSLLGFELLLIHHMHAIPPHLWLLAAPLIIVLLGARWLIVNITTRLTLQSQHLSPRFNALLTWGGLRGGLAFALALALPAQANRNLLIALTFIVVCFSVIIQSSSIKPLLKSGASTAKS